MNINFNKNKDGLIPAIIQDNKTNTVLMLGYMNQVALDKTLETKKVTFYSRSKQRLWTKGEESGNFLNLVSIKEDCDNDSLLIKVNPRGATCHKGTDTCWQETNTQSFGFLSKLEQTITERRQNAKLDKSYVASLFDKGINKIAQKVGEEAVEVVIEAKDNNDVLFVSESADLLFHYLILLQAKGFFEYESVIFKDISDPSIADSLIVSVKFKDGDGDLGLDATDPADNAAPYNDKNYMYTTTGAKVNYKAKRTNPAYANLPSFVNPYNCINWEITTVNGKTDTLYFDLNPNHNNIFIDYLMKNSDGTFKEFNWLTEFVYPNCGISYDGRFPRLYKDLTHRTPIEGSIRYGMNSVGFLILFSTKTLKLRITILDRSLHTSNTIETPEFTLQSIKKSG